MTRKHFEMVARCVRESLTSTAGDATLHAAAQRLADAFEAENARFDRDRFLAACGIDTRQPQPGQFTGYAEIAEETVCIAPPCPVCECGTGTHLGRLGNTDHFRCRMCGNDFSRKACKAQAAGV